MLDIAIMSDQFLEPYYQVDPSEEQAIIRAENKVGGQQAMRQTPAVKETVRLVVDSGNQIVIETRPQEDKLYVPPTLNKSATCCSLCGAPLDVGK